MIYAATIVWSAFLLFVVQPAIAKQILPWFGGAASVWTTCMVFFQVLLLLGYAYSDALVSRMKLRSQVVVHLAVLAVSVLSLPIIAPGSLKPHDGTQPILRVIAVLSVTVGLPYFVLSTTGPVMQAWSSRRSAGQRVYRLYALSNVASIAALAAYPFAIEPFMSTRLQAIAWSVAYAGFVIVAAGSAIVTWRVAAVSDMFRPTHVVDAGSAPESSFASGETSGHPLTTRSALVVVGLTALASILLLSVTAHLTRDVASVPFLWMVPLLVYLLSFVLCFDGRGWYRRAVYLPLSAAFVVAMLATETFRAFDVRLSLPVHAAGLFVCCMLCHGEVVARRPVPRHLTRFYLALSAGGAIGGLFVSIVASLVFPANLELPFALCAVALMVYVGQRRTLRFVGAAAVILTIGLTAALVVGLKRGTVALSRNFYGTLRVTRDAGSGGAPDLLRLSHGAILHGQQFISRDLRATPTTYFGPTSGVARTIALFRPRPIRAGIVGLGAGTLAAYGRAGDYLRFYELDAEVERYARTYFHFIEDTLATVDVALGDARLSLEREPSQEFDLIVVDAFSSDSIPVHLLTREAVAVYRRHLRSGGAIAFHVSNKYLDLASIVGDLAAESRMRAIKIEDRPKDKRAFAPSDWVIASSNEALLRRLEASQVTAATPHNGLRTWTDDYSNLFAVLKLRQDVNRP